MTFDPVACDNWIDSGRDEYWNEDEDQEKIDRLESDKEDQERGNHD